MQKIHHNFSIQKPILVVPYSYCASGAESYCACLCPMGKYIVNIKITIIAPPCVNYKLTFVKNQPVPAIIAGLYLCSRAFRFVRNVSSRAFFVALGFAQCLLFSANLCRYCISAGLRTCPLFCPCLKGSPFPPALAGRNSLKS